MKKFFVFLTIFLFSIVGNIKRSFSFDWSKDFTSKSVLDDPTYISFALAVAVDYGICVGRSFTGNDSVGEAVVNVASAALGNKCHKDISKYLFGCDAYEEVGILDSVANLGSGNKKSKVCAANTIVKSVLKGVEAVTAITGGFGIAIAAEALSVVAEMISIKSKYKNARDISMKYEVCLNEDAKSDGRPLPYTDSQIVRLLKLSGEIPSINSIVDKYDKLCIHDIDNDIYQFYKKDSVVDNIYITHMTGYAYVYCASVFSACPCIYNLQHGTVEEPEYEYDDNGIVKIDENTGELKFNEKNGNLTKEEYQQHYAKHCRIIRYKDLYEQSNDLLPVFGDSCYDNVGYSKASVPLSSAFVQCIEDTAKNIFEKPVFSSKRSTKPSDDMIGVYEKDIEFIQDKYKQLLTIIQGRTMCSLENGDVPFREDELKAGLEILQSIFYTNDENSFQTYANEYVCFQGKDGKYTTTKHTTDIYRKYIDGEVVKNTMPNCCFDSASINTEETCYSNDVKIESILNEDGANCKTFEEEVDRNIQNVDVMARESYKTAILKSTTSISANTLLNETKKVAKLIEVIAEKQSKATKALSVMVDDTESTFWTLFDLFRIKIKALAVVALVLWFFLMGYKMMNGDFGEIKESEIAKIIMKVVLCYFMVFNDNMKNFVFNFMINTANGIGMLLNTTTQSLRSQHDNAFGGKCNFGSRQTFTPKQIEYKTEDAERIIIGKDIACRPWEELTDSIPDVLPSSVIVEKNNRRYTCAEKEFICVNGEQPHCEEYYKDENGKDTEHCKSAKCGLLGVKNAIRTYNGMYHSPREYNVYEFSCPATNVLKICVKTDSYNLTSCEKQECRILTASCEDVQTTDGAGLTLNCSRYDVNPKTGELLDNCVQGSCFLSRGDYMMRPNFERPYKLHEYYSIGKGMTLGLKPHCHRKTNPNEEYGEPKKIYSPQLNDYIWVCTEDGTEMDAGYRLKDLVGIGLVDGDMASIRLFKGILTDDELEQLDDVNVTDGQTQLTREILGRVIPTAVATTNPAGVIKEIDFSVGNKSTEGYQRQQYTKYLTSRLSYINRGSQYPIFSKYGLTRNYTYLSMWDMVDCKFLQYLTFSSSSNFGDNIEETLRETTQSGITTKSLSSATNAFLEMLKFVILAFPFGLLCFVVSMMVALILFMLVARAAQQYAVCIFNLVCVMYLSPFIFVLYLFNQTESAIKTWMKDVKDNILGASIPFISVSIFLVITDWVFFGDPAKYKSAQLFLSSGNINPNCYEGDLSGAPIACLSTRLLAKYHINGSIIEMILGWVQALVDKETYKIAGYLLLKLLLGAAVIALMTQAMDEIEKQLYDVFDAKPDKDIGMGFEGSASGAVLDGAKAGFEAGKFALNSAAMPFKMVTSTISKAATGGAGGGGPGGGIGYNGSAGSGFGGFTGNYFGGSNGNGIGNMSRSGLVPMTSSGDTMGSLGSQFDQGVQSLFNQGKNNEANEFLKNKDSILNSLMKQDGVGSFSVGGAHLNFNTDRLKVGENGMLTNSNGSFSIDASNAMSVGILSRGQGGGALGADITSQLDGMRSEMTQIAQQAKAKIDEANSAIGEKNTSGKSSGGNSVSRPSNTTPINSGNNNSSGSGESS